MIYEKDLDEAIAECQGKRNPDASTCMKLAAFYTIKHFMYGKTSDDPSPAPPAYSYAPAPDGAKVIIDSDSEFARTIDGKDQADVWPVIDELMQTLAAVQPKVYAAVMQKLY